MSAFHTMADLERACRDLPAPHAGAAGAARARQASLAKPPGSLGRLEELAAWLAAWQGVAVPHLDAVDTLIFAGSHGVARHGMARHGVSSRSEGTTADMVANFAAGGAAIWQLAELGQARLRVVPLALNRPTGDIATGPAMNERTFLDAVRTGYEAVEPGTELLMLGEMGIGNTKVAAALAAGLFGGRAADWGNTEGDDAAVDAALARTEPDLAPLDIARTLGGREFAALLGAALAARHHRVPVLLDGFACTAAVAPLARIDTDALAHCRFAHLSAGPGHRRLLEALGGVPLLELGIWLGEGSGAAVALLLARAAVACHAGMATIAGAAVPDHP